MSIDPAAAAVAELLAAQLMEAPTYLQRAAAAGRITRGQRKVFLRLAEHWPWTLALARAFRRLRLIPLPA
ncbi:MAG: transposase [Actinobacteria bacterium]|nr:transposase [Actinomycetota bacterium]